MSETTDNASLVNRAAHQPIAMTGYEGRDFIAVPARDGAYELREITSPNKADVLMPKVVHQLVRMKTAESFNEYVGRFHNSDTVIFADIDRDSITAIIDYHGCIDREDAKPLNPRLAVHRAQLDLPKSLEWQTWSKVSGTLMSHTAFATFLEENAIDVVSPAGADLLELCRDLQVLQNVSFGSTVRMGDLTQVNYQKDNDATTKGGVALPQSIMLSIPVYFGEPSVAIMAFMRRHIEDGKLKLGIQLSRAENVRQDEFHRIVDAIQSAVELTTLYGTPA